MGDDCDGDEMEIRMEMCMEMGWRLGWRLDYLALHVEKRLDDERRADAAGERLSCLSDDIEAVGNLVERGREWDSGRVR